MHRITCPIFAVVGVGFVQHRIVPVVPSRIELDAASSSPQEAFRTQHGGIRRISVAMFWLWILIVPAIAQRAAEKQDAESPDVADKNAAAVTGFVIDVPVPLDTDAASAVIDQLVRASEAATGQRRVTVLMRYLTSDTGSAKDSTTQVRDETAFEDALRLARAMTGNQLRSVRTVCWLDRELNGHSILPVMASDLIVVGPAASLGGVGRGEAANDETLELNYQAIAKRRGLFPAGVVKALVNPDLELAVVTKVGGERTFLSGEELDQMRQGGELLEEEVWSRPAQPLVISGSQLRSARIASANASSMAELLERLDLADAIELDEVAKRSVSNAVLLEITGSIAPTRSKRWQSNLTSTLSSNETDAWMISMDSIGGSLSSSATLAAWFADPPPPLVTVAGYIRGEARGDAALIAMACKPLKMNPEARLGGQGAEVISLSDLRSFDETIAEIASQTNRPAALIRGLLNPDLEVYRYTNRKTGRIRYSAAADLLESDWDPADGQAGDLGNPADASEPPVSDNWERGERIELADGLSANEAIALGLADGTSESLEQASRQIGLEGSPPPVAERTLIRWVERLGRSTGLSFLLLFIGFAALSSEANAPGLSVPGFIALICFAMFFWMKFLAGTAEWFELLALSLGLICIAIEIFVVPGFGIFGIGGLALTVLGIVLMSQTFVIPQNVYQIGIFTRGVWGAIFAATGVFGGFLVMRWLFPHVPFFSGLVMEAPDGARLDQSEMLVNYENLIGRTGPATTPLRPSGKARFGDQIVPVISDGSLIDAGEEVRVCEVHASRVIVELVERPQESS